MTPPPLPLTPCQELKAQYGNYVVRYLKKWHRLVRITDHPVPIQVTSCIRIWTALHHNFKAKGQHLTNQQLGQGGLMRITQKHQKSCWSGSPEDSEEEGDISEEMVMRTHLLAKPLIRDPRGR